jgi:hypothetical protein
MGIIQINRNGRENSYCDEGAIELLGWDGSFYPKQGDSVMEFLRTGEITPR